MTDTAENSVKALKEGDSSQYHQGQAHLNVLQ